MRSKMRERKKRVDTNAAQGGPARLNPAFAHLDLKLRESRAPEPVSKPSQGHWKLGRVVLRRETAHRGGKTVIVIHDFATHLPNSIIETMARKLRQACGCGGTVRDRTIEIQGDQPGKIRALLETEGFEVAGIK